VSQRNSSALLAAVVAALAVIFCWTWVHSRRPVQSNLTIVSPAQAVDSTVRTLLPEDLAHGTEQLEKMLSHRPTMRAYLTPDDEIYDWARRQFAGEQLRTRVFWLQDDPKAGQEAECFYDPDANPPAYIRVRVTWAHGPQQGEEKTFEELWSETVYELINIRLYARYCELWADALAGHVSKEQWVRRNAALGLEIAEITRDFYKELWVPLCREHSIGSTPERWYVTMPLDVDEALASMGDDDGPNAHWYRYWNSAWDNKIAPHLAASRPAAESRPASGVGP
jgi:hypothetical protein